jgi:hypothetical protein
MEALDTELQPSLDDLVFPVGETDKVSVAMRAEKARVTSKFDPLIEELKAIELDIADLTTLTEAGHLILTVRSYFSRASAVYGEVLLERRRAQGRRDVSKNKLEQKIADMIRNDPEIRGMTPQAVQQARAANKASEAVNLASGCQELYVLLLGYAEMIEALVENLKAASRDLYEFTRTMRDAKSVGESGIPLGHTDEMLPL